MRARPLVMGVLNTTPDSFSDGGRWGDAAGAIAAAERMRAEGADLIDVGGESTRPGAAPVLEAEELSRVLPVIAALAGRARLSIDTQKPSVARAAAAAGATVLNDVQGLILDEMVEASALFEVTVVMHMRGSPATMGSLTDYDDLEGEVHARLHAAAARARSPAVWIDPGVGFAKTTTQNLRLLGRLDRLVALGWPVLIGASRKRFIGEVLGLPAPDDRLVGSLAAVAAAYRAGAQIFRVHDVAATRQLLDMLWAIEGAAGPTEAEAPG